MTERLETSKIRDYVLSHYPTYFGDPNAKGIDVGCSRDPLTPACVAFDRSDYPEVTHRGDARELPFADEEFAWLWSSHVLEDFDDTMTVLREWIRVVEPKGLIGLYVPEPMFYAKYGSGNTEHKHPGFTPEQLSEYLICLDCAIAEAKVDFDLSDRQHPHYSTLVIARKR